MSSTIHHVILTANDPERLDTETQEAFGPIFTDVCREHGAELTDHSFDNDRAHLHVDLESETFPMQLRDWLHAHTARAYNALPMNTDQQFRWARSFYAGRVDTEEESDE